MSTVLGQDGCRRAMERNWRVDRGSSWGMDSEKKGGCGCAEVGGSGYDK